jgi:UDP-N-acetylglucosamine--N-acetylmuramyl-(pentapeptide) pyrophosphoryl-undecaprenol N-acetylglucosamine transferase
MRILFVGGGSIGHVAPCVAVWRAVQAETKGAAAHFICSERPEDAAFLEKERVDFTAVRGRRLSVLTFGPAFLRARGIIKRFRPDVVFSKGGALSVPVAYAARAAGVPVVLHESDAVGGRANTLVAKWAKAVCAGFSPKLTGAKRDARTTFTGNPVRPEITQGDRQKGLKLCGFAGKKPVLLVLGGSQGAVALNDAVSRHLPELLAYTDIAHLTGVGKAGAGETPGYWSAPFAQEELPDLYAAADMALSRAGAGSISELASNGVPAVLVPLEGLAQDHQTRNAEAAAKQGGCVLIRQQDLDARLVEIVRDWAEHAQTRRLAGEMIRGLETPDAAGRIARVLRDAMKH